MQTRVFYSNFDIMKTTRSVHTLILGFVLCTALMANKRDTRPHAPPKPEVGAWDDIATDNTYAIELNNTHLFIPYESIGVITDAPIKLNNDCIAPMRPVMAEHSTGIKPYKVITWPDSKRYIRWLLRPQCTAIH